MPSILLVGAVAAVGIFGLMNYYILSQLTCPVFACTVTPSGALAEHLEIFPILVAGTLAAAALVLLSRSRREQQAPRLNEPAGNEGTSL